MLLQKLYLANATETVDIRVTDGKFYPRNGRQI